MRLRDGYVLRELEGDCYLLPFGQNAAEHRRGILLNESGVLLYNGLRKGLAEGALLELLVEHYEAEESDIPRLKQDIKDFLNHMRAFQILITDEYRASAGERYYFEIAGLTVCYEGPKALLHPNFGAFACDLDASLGGVKDEADQRIHVVAGHPRERITGNILIRTAEILIGESEAEYFLLFPGDADIFECRMKKDGSEVSFYCRMQGADLAEQMFHAMRFPFLVLAQRRGLFAVHSASILYQDQAWLFSGASGMGKSTHVKLWEKLYQTPILNGDLNLLGFSGDTPMVYGIPWCGTSETFTAQAYPLGGITLLKQQARDACIAMSESEKQLRVLQRFISPGWTAEMFLQHLDFAGRLLASVPVFRLLCTKNDTAAQTMKQAIDSILTPSNKKD